LDKPSGMTSRAAGGRVARMFGVKKFGHLGTLDPMASGVLPIALGNATKMIPFLEELWKRPHFDDLGRRMGEKEYAFGVEWGYETDTLDVTGKIIKQDGRLPDYKEIDRFCDGYKGEILQTPPAFSAIRIGGRHAYELARRGADIKMPSRKVTIYDLVLGSGGPAGKMKYSAFLANCGTGTYVRSLARDIGDLSGGYLATVSGIRRTRTHNFVIKDAQTLDFLEKVYHNAPAELRDYLNPADFGLDDILVAELHDDDAALFGHGGVIVTKDDSAGLRRVYHNGRFIGIGRNDNYVLMPRRVINN